MFNQGRSCTSALRHLAHDLKHNLVVFHALRHLWCVWMEGLGGKRMEEFIFQFKITDTMKCFLKVNILTL